MRRLTWAALAAGLAAGTAHAQAVAPMTQTVGSLTDRYMVRLAVLNPYPDPRRFNIAVFDPDGEPIAHWSDFPSFDLAPSASKTITVAASFDGARSKDIYICAETRIEGATGAVRGQVCSHVLASRLDSPA